MKKPFLFFAFVVASCFARAAADTLLLQNSHIRIEWTKSSAGWQIRQVQVHSNNSWQQVGAGSGEYTLLHDREKPSATPDTVFSTITGTRWPDTVYKYQVSVWKDATAPVALNRAGAPLYFYPDQAVRHGKAITFTRQLPVGKLTATWQLDDQYAGDVRVALQLDCSVPGFYSLASPSLLTVADNDVGWATVPGYFQGNRIPNNFILAYAYGQGIPALPVVYRDRCASTLSPIITTKKHVSISVIPDPGLARDPWAADKNTHQDWQLGLSHKNRKSELSPTLYYPVLGEHGSELNAGNSIHYGFRYSLLEGEWYDALKHTVNDIYHFKEALALRTNRQSLVDRVEKMQHYLSDRRTSLWNIETFRGMQIGGQSYLGGVVGSNHDAIKNSDYGAMWMLAAASADPYLKDSVLPYALNFKLAQQDTSGFFRGAAIGQYYLANSKHFTEEWGEFVEPVSLTYYIMLDIGNILLFEPGNEPLKKRLAMGADLLLNWQKPDGSWEVAYDKFNHQPLFTDLKDLRPTFYGLMVAYRILKDQKYLEAAKKGADWFLANAVAKGDFIGVCGDARYAPDFATGQSAQALLDLYDMTKDKRYLSAAITTGRMYLGSIYTQPIAGTNIKTVNGRQRQDWEIAQAGLSFEHGGIIGSANRAGPIMLCSHAGLFVRLFALTRDSLFIEMARAAAIGRDAFVDSSTSVATYYWNAMNKGAGPYPHHAWWQIGWITDYLMAEAQLRSANNIVFPRGFVTPKVGPHQSYGFATGKIYGQPAALLIKEGVLICDNPNVDYVLARSPGSKKLFLILLNDRGTAVNANLGIHPEKAGAGYPATITALRDLRSGQSLSPSARQSVSIEGYGIKVYSIE